MLYADGLIPVEPSPEFEAFRATTNKAGDTIDDIYHKICLDFSIFEAYALQIIYNSEGKISQIYHVDPNNVRAEAPNEFGQVEKWYISKEWGDITNKKNKRASEKTRAVCVPNFNPKTWEEDEGIQLLYVKRYVAGSDVYAIPSYNSALNWVQLDHELSKFELNKVASGFFPTLILYMAGDPSEEQKDEFKNKFERKYIGSDKSKVLYIWGTGSDEKPEVVRLEADSNDTLFNELNDISAQKIATAHGGSLSLAGIEGKGADLSGDANRLNTSLAFYQKNIIRPMQKTIFGGLNKIMDMMGFPDVTVDYIPLDVDLTIEAKEEDELKDKKKKGLIVEKNN